MSTDTAHRAVNEQARTHDAAAKPEARQGYFPAGRLPWLDARLASMRERREDFLRAARGESRGHLVLVMDGEEGSTVHAGEPQISPVWTCIKRLADVCFASVLLLLAAPVMIVVAATVAASGGPILFRQARVGRHGEMFRLVKFRTMVPDAESKLNALLLSNPELRKEWDLTQKLQDDPRITRYGAFLRHSSLDELPQLFNVLAGHMSIVGPRPVIPDELARYGASARWYTAVKPGVTGLWQVSGRNDTSYARRVALDVHYVRMQRIWLDAFILVKTIYVVLLGKGAH